MSFNEMMLMQQNFSLEDFLFLSSEIQANTVDSFTMSSTVSMNLFNATSLTHEEKDKKCEMVIISLRAILYSLVMIIILLASVIGNTIVIAAILMSSLLRRRTTMHFVTSLAFSDLLLSVTLIPWKLSMVNHEWKFCHSLAACYIYLLTDTIGNVASILNLLLIAIDRFIAVTLPFRYPELITTKRAKTLITVIWVFAMFWSAVGLFKWDNTETLAIKLENNFCKNENAAYYATSFFGVYITSLFVMTCTYLKILHIAKRHINAIEATTPASSIYKPSITKEQNIKEKRRKKFNREVKATKSVGIVYLAFVVCWLPSCIISIIIMIDKKYFPNMENSHPTLFNFLYSFFIVILPSMNTMINPVIYSFSNKQFLKAFKQVVYNIMMRRKSAIVERRSTQESSLKLSIRPI